MLMGTALCATLFVFSACAYDVLQYTERNTPRHLTASLSVSPTMFLIFPFHSHLRVSTERFMVVFFCILSVPPVRALFSFLFPVVSNHDISIFAVLAFEFLLSSHVHHFSPFAFYLSSVFVFSFPCICGFELVSLFMFELQLAFPSFPFSLFPLDILVLSSLTARKKKTQ